MQKIKERIRDIPDFPKKGIIFKDITPVLSHADSFRQTVDAFLKELKKDQADVIVGIESRGFILSPVLAYEMGTGFVPVRKKGKLPAKTREKAYALEYGEAVLEIHEDAFKPGTRVVIVDDLLATGGTALAAAHLVENLGGKVVKIVFLVELKFLKGREKLAGYDIFSLIQY